MCRAVVLGETPHRRRQFYVRHPIAVTAKSESCPRAITARSKIDPR